VIDPLRSLAKGRPEMMSFRVFPPDYNPPLNQTPDGTYVTDDRIRVEKWGTIYQYEYVCVNLIFLNLWKFEYVCAHIHNYMDVHS
jgi:hypothetical protein